MATYLPLSANNSPQIASIPGGINGYQFAMLSFATAPSSGTVSLDYRLIGSSLWVPVKVNAAITNGEAYFHFEGAIAAVRVTFSGLVGGISPELWISSQPTAMPPFDLMTDGGTGPSRRLRVDSGQTGFFAGRMFRSYINALILKAGPSLQFRFTSPIDFILWSQVMTLTQGALDFRIYTGSTASGSWTQRPVIGVNRMAARPLPYYVSQCTFETGGNFSGGTEVDVLELRTAAANNTASNINGTFSERGLPAGVYFGRFQTLTGGLVVNDDAQLDYSLIWEERPA